MTGLAPSTRARRRVAHGFTIAVLLAWLAATNAVPPYLLPDPLSVARRLLRFLIEGGQFYHVAVSLFHLGVAVAGALLIGCALAMLPFVWPVFAFAVDRRLAPFLNAFSGIGWVMLAVLWFGVTHGTVLFAMVAVLVPFPLIALRTAMAALDAERLEMAASYTRRGARRFGKIVLPSLVPVLAAALRATFGAGWKVVLVIEFIGGNSGLGYLMNIARQQFDAPTVFAIIVLIVVVVHGFDRLVLAPLETAAARFFGG